MPFPQEKTSAESFRLPVWLEVLLVIVVALELVVPFITNNIGMDGPTYIYWSSSFYDLLHGGTLIPRWLPGGFHGYGAPSFYFYPPLYFYFSALVRDLTGLSEANRLMQVSGFIITIASFFSAWMFLRTIGARKYNAALGAFLYTFAPFRLAELYMRETLPSHLAYVFLPSLFCGAYLLFSQRREWIGILLFSLSMACLFLSAVQITIVTAAILIFLALVERKRLNIHIVRNLAFASLISAGLVSYHLITILEYGPSVHLSALIKTPANFFSLLVEGIALPAVYHFILLYIGAAALVIVYVLHLKKKVHLNERETAVLRISFAVIILLAFLDTPFLSVPVWERISILVQGPWRYYIYFVFIAALAAGVCASKALRKSLTFITILWSFGAILPAVLLLLDLHLFSPHVTVGQGDTWEYLPKDVPLSFMQHEPADRTYSSANIDSTAEALSGQIVTFHRFYWPAWHLYADGNEISTHPDTIGRARARIPEGIHVLEWKLLRTPEESACLWISGVTAALVCFGTGISFTRRTIKKYRP